MQDSDESKPTTALIDSATILSVSRILGKTLSNTRESVDGDISAFENFITAFLFFDKVGFLNDSNAATGLAAIFENKAPGGLLISLSVDESLALNSARIIQKELISTTDRLKSGTELIRFLSLIGYSIATNWEEESGRYYLAGHLLGISSDQLKSSKMFQMVRDCSTNRPFSRSEAERIVSGPIWNNSTFYIAISSLNWLLYRTMYYSIAARLHDSSLVLHPIRSLFSASKILPQMDVPPALCEHVLSLLSHEGITTSKKIRANIEPNLANLSVPLFSAWIASKSDKPVNFIKTMLSLRSEKSFVRVRDLFRSMSMEANPSAARTSLRKNNEFIRSIDSCSHELLEKYGIETPQGIQVSKIINFVNWGSKLSGHPVDIPEIEATLPIKIHSFLGKFTANPYKQMLRSAVDDIAAIPRLGGVHERITRDMRFSA